ncbi:uncharacterized protein M421DRAFT_418504 [Didymella exigua CBS 183.55]|uniref:Uncharacterized protein n=1 Tax=Didymella exigua CBS 183.55 TaxID=1150837 RepID=A0A6A5RRG2_9PLEO|nr:uncharacterized protein M421DRAFT_418504 [Didymella exigua CBS 183.55]KAF1931021.1 hypothetical protein M421DRAFT_418504 [Didymella exigua CBS 183.55]
MSTGSHLQKCSLRHRHCARRPRQASLSRRPSTRAAGIGGGHTTFLAQAYTYTPL